jgi:hypothetical protein
MTRVGIYPVDCPTNHSSRPGIRAVQIAQSVAGRLTSAVTHIKELNLQCKGVKEVSTIYETED